MKKIILAASLAALFTAGQALAETIKIGVTPAEHAQIMEQVKKIAAAKGLDIDIVEFSDYVVPNQHWQTVSFRPTPSSTSLTSTTRSLTASSISSASAPPSPPRWAFIRRR